MMELTGLDSDDWGPGVVYFIRNTYNLRFFSLEVKEDETCMAMIAKIENYYHNFFTTPIRQKTVVISADSITSSPNVPIIYR
jgi:hypothetical protein